MKRPQVLENFARDGSSGPLTFSLAVSDVARLAKYALALEAERDKLIRELREAKLPSVEEVQGIFARARLTEERDQARQDADRLIEMMEEVGRWLAAEDAPLSVIQSIEWAISAYREAQG